MIGSRGNPSQGPAPGQGTAESIASNDPAGSGGYSTSRTPAAPYRAPQNPAREAIPGAQTQVIVKFRDELELPATLFTLPPLHGEPAAALPSALQRIHFLPHLAGLGAALRELMRKAVEMSPHYQPRNLLNYRSVIVASRHEGERLVRSLRSVPQVELAYLHPGPVQLPSAPASPVNPQDDPLACKQEYLDPQPRGLDARFAWTRKGGDGAGIKLADVEWGWDFLHTDLAGLNAPATYATVQLRKDHGTCVLGVIAARDNDTHCIGIAPGLQTVHPVGQWRAGNLYATDLAVAEAAILLDAGDVLLIEAQTLDYTFGHFFLPLETEAAVFDVVEAATAAGIVVVQSAGNGSADLDTVMDGNLPVFNRAQRDSGAILVAAGRPDSKPSWQPWKETCRGSRIDCFAWGESVVTLTSDTNGTVHDQWTDAFAGTSSAAAMVAGAALVLQGVMRADTGSVLSPAELRSLLSDTSLNTPSADPANDRIGVMPDLRAIIQSLAAQRKG